jgi:hypothetical protein
MALVVLVLGIGFFGLNVAAVYKIITKAGYSGYWILLVVAPFVAYLIGIVVLANEVRSRDFHVGSFAGWLGLAGLLAFVEYIFFLVFAFSDWPALRQRGQAHPPGYGYGYGRAGPRPPSGTGPGMPPPLAGSPPAPAQPLTWPAGGGGWPRTQGGGWSDPSDRLRD